MGSHFRKLILAPRVEEGSVRDLALRLRARSPHPVTLTFCDLAGRRVRNPQLRAAQAVGVRQVEIEGVVAQALLCELAESILGAGSWLYREQDDEELDVCHPGPQWLTGTFGAGDLSWLLQPEEKPVPWNRRSYYALPGNPDAWDVTVPIARRLLLAARPLEPRPCPSCGMEFASKRQDRCQCPHCGVVSRPFATMADALTLENAPLDAFGWGRCPRCQWSRQFTSVVEQCHRCGRLLKAGSSHALSLADNVAEVERILRSL